MAEKQNKTRGLGRGLSTLMSDIRPEQTRPDQDAGTQPGSVVPIDSIRPNPDQPRRYFDPEQLRDLGESIRERGVIQPIIVRRDPAEPTAYQIVAGERRWRAAQAAQLHDVPIILRDYSDAEVLEVAIIENIQRSDLNPIDEASGYRQLMDRFGHTQELLSKVLGKSRSHIANQMRLLTLPPEIQSYLANGSLTAGHARPLIGHPRAEELARQIVQKKLSAREAERLARKPETSGKAMSKGPRRDKDADTRTIEQELSATLKMGVSIDHNQNGDGGRLTLTYRNLDQLDDLLRALSGG